MRFASKIAPESAACQCLVCGVCLRLRACHPVRYPSRRQRGQFKIRCELLGCITHKDKSSVAAT
jgi:hypothetical protein